MSKSFGHAKVIITWCFTLSCIAGLSLYTIFSSASIDTPTFGVQDTQAIQKVDEYIQTHSDPERVISYLESILQKNLSNQRVQLVLWAVVSNFYDTRIDDEQSVDTKINTRLEDVLTTLNKRRQEKSKNIEWLEIQVPVDTSTAPTRVAVEAVDKDIKQELQEEIDESDGGNVEKKKEQEKDIENKENDVVPTPESAKNNTTKDDETKTKTSATTTVLEYTEPTFRPKLATETFDQKFGKLVTEWVYDEHAVEQARLWWVNVLRAERGLELMTTNFKLRETARDWSVSLRDKQVADHKRGLDSVYYDYPAITQWFADRGVVFENHSGATSTENIWRARHTCSRVKPGEDCTQEVIADLRRIFDYFAAEESYNGVHWRTMIHPRFLVVGVSFAPGTDDKVYAVMHYGTKVVE